METISFDKLLLRTAFCCMASDGNIDAREIASTKKLCEESEIFSGFNFTDEINLLVNLINSEGKTFIRQFLSHLNDSELSYDEQLTILDFAKRVRDIKKCNLVVNEEITTNYGFNCSNNLFEKDYNFKFNDSIESMYYDIVENIDNITFDIKRKPR